MSTTTDVSNADDIIDSRQVIERIEELEARFVCDCDPVGEVHADDCNCMADPLDADEERELDVLRALAVEGEGFSDWSYGETMVRDSYWEEYAQEVANDLGYMDAENAGSWPFNCINWERAARELQMDYSSIDFDGVTYWIR